MSQKDYLSGNREKVVESLRKLMANLKVEAPDWSKTVHSLEVYSDLPENECFAQVGKEIWRVSLKNGALEGGELQMPRREYTSFFQFNVGEASYLAAGYPTERSGRKYCSGITVANLKETEENRSIKVIMEEDTKRGFQSLGIWAISPEPYQCLLVAAHSDIGIIGVPLEELCGDGYVKIDLNNLSQKRYLLYEKNKSREEHIRMTIAGERLYVAEGCKLFTIAQPDGERKKSPESFIKQLYHTYSQPVTALGRDSHETIYTATLGGNLFEGKELYYHAEWLTLVTKIVPGTYNAEEGIFYQGKINNSISPVFFTDGKTERVISPSDVTVLDFSPRKGYLWMLTSEEVLFR
ncbi:MAG: hypothetical protein AABY26_03205, partial [Nanoarchaeota archaeon]